MDVGQAVRVVRVRDAVFSQGVGRVGILRQHLPGGRVEVSLPYPVLDPNGRAHNPMFVRADDVEVVSEQ